MRNKQLLIGIVVLVALALVALGSVIMGAGNGRFGGLNHNVIEDFSEGISVDGTTRIGGDGIFYPVAISELVSAGDLTTITATDTVTTAAVICDSTYLKQTPTANLTFHLPDAADLIADCIPNAGDHKTFWFDNMAATAVIAVATETDDLIFHTAQTNDEYIGAGEIGRIDLVTLSTTSVSVMMTSY